ncbi:MAG: MBL fold metallo-hydrolase [Clostridia bacterium]|nr:MBL fold metallo-hydrolase [Clostridia bacterium]
MLQQLTDRVWIYPYEEARDRPNLCLICGDRFSVAVDAGHSRAHVDAFYQALSEKHLPLPELTVLTHWHWDHTFGLHAIHGQSIAGRKTEAYLSAFRDRVQAEGKACFLELHESIRREYAGNTPVVITLPDMTFTGEMRVDAGNCGIRIWEAPSPHTDDAVLILVEEEGVLFLGDAACGVFPSWVKDPHLSAQLSDAIAGVDAKLCVEGHAEPMTKNEMLSELMKV